MRFIDYIGLAFKNIGRQKLRSALTIFAVVIGATSVTIMLSLVTGAKGFVQHQFEASGTLQQVIVTQATDLDYNSARQGGGSKSDGVPLTDALASKIAAVPHVVAVSPTFGVFNLDSIQYNGKKLALQNTQAFQPNAAITNTMIAGRDLNATDGTGTITLTDSYADKLGFKGNYNTLIGKTVTLQTQNGYSGVGAAIPPAPQPQQPGPGNTGNNNNPMDPNSAPATTLPAKVVGIVSSDSGDAAIYMPLSWGKDLMTQQMWQVTPQDQAAVDKANQQMQQQQTHPGNHPSSSMPVQPKYTLVKSSQLDRQGYSNLTVKVDKTSNAEAVAKTVRTYGVGATTAKSFVSQQLQILNIVGLVLGGIGGIALLVAAVGVVNTMIMAILERTREIGVMRACGATRASVRRLFTFEASMLGFWGGAFGLAIGYGLTRVANIFINQQLKGNNIAASNIVTIPLWLIGSVLAITTLIGMLAGLYPASRAARLNPVEALRYE